MMSLWLRRAAWQANGAAHVQRQMPPLITRGVMRYDEVQDARAARGWPLHDR